MASMELSETDKTRLSSEVAESFIDSYYTALNAARQTISTFYIPPIPNVELPHRSLPIINYNGDTCNDGVLFQKKFDEMPYTFYEAQSINATVLNPCVDPELPKKSNVSKKEIEGNISLMIQVNGYLRLNERKDGPLRGFADDFILVPNKEIAGGKGTGKQNEGRQFLIQTQNFRFVV